MSVVFLTNFLLKVTWVSFFITAFDVSLTSFFYAELCQVWHFIIYHFNFNKDSCLLYTLVIEMFSKIVSTSTEMYMYK